LEGTIENQVVLNPPNFKEAIRNGEDFYIQFSLMSPLVEEHLIKVLHRELENYDILYMKDMLLTVLKELINNAVKANAKRLFFRKKGLDIREKEEYRDGMETFKEEVFSDESSILNELPEAKLVVRVFFKVLPDNLRISIINNIAILEEELVKVESRVKKAYSYKDISDAFDDVLDDSEGAGLGLTMALILFKNIGLPPETFSITTDGKLTIAKINIPRRTDAGEFSVKIAEGILQELENIPSFPENIIEIQRLCGNPDSTIREIADSIKRDPGLTTALLKLANSAGYITIKKIETIEEAVKIIGTKGINMLLVATGVQKVLDSRYKKFETIWKNSYRTAFYAQRIAMQIKHSKMSEFAYLAALLCDIGRIVLLSIGPDKINRLIEITGNRNLAETAVIEEITLGVSHSTLGSLICKKWKFNDALVKAIEFHHRPHMAPERFRDLAYTVYLSYIFNEIENRNCRFEIVDEDVLEYFNLNNRKNFEMLHKVLKDAYEANAAAR
jgi:HD-like signal output (HDOD) protein